MQDLISVAAIAVRTQLLTDPQLAALVINPAGQYKIFLEAAEGQADAPYIIMHQIWGGDINRSPVDEFDITFRVDCIARTAIAARQLAGLVRGALLHQTLPYPSGWGDWSGVTFTGGAIELINVQGVQFWAFEQFIRLRAVL